MAVPELPLSLPIRTLPAEVYHHGGKRSTNAIER